MTTSKDSKYDRLERKFVEVAQKILDDFNIPKEDLFDIIKEQCEEIGETNPCEVEG